MDQRFPNWRQVSSVPHIAFVISPLSLLGPFSLWSFSTHTFMMLTQLLCYLEGLVLYMDFSELLLAVQSPQELYKFQLRYHLFWNIYIVCSPISFKSLLRCPIYNKKRPCTTLSLLIILNPFN